MAKTNVALTRMLFLGLVFACQSFAQTIPDAPKPQPEHRFFDIYNVGSITLSAWAIAEDSYSTQRAIGLNHGIYETNPLAAPFVKTARGQVFISSAGLGSEIGGMYLFHRLEGRARSKPARTTFFLLEHATPLAISVIEFRKWHQNNQVIAGVCASYQNVGCK